MNSDAYSERNQPQSAFCRTTLLGLSRTVVCCLLIASAVRFSPAADSKISRPMTPARGHYAKLGLLDPKPAAPNLPIDAQRFKGSPKFSEEAGHSQREF